MHKNSKFEKWEDFYKNLRENKNVSDPTLDLARKYIEDLKNNLGISDSDFSLGRSPILTYYVPNKNIFGNIRFNTKSIKVEIIYSGLNDIQHPIQSDNYEMHKIKIDSKNSYLNNKDLIFKLAHSAFKFIDEKDYNIFFANHLNEKAKSKDTTIEVQEDSEPIAIEGESKLAIHMRKERDNTFIKKLKIDAFKLDSYLKCEGCEFSFYETYGELGKGFIEAHHLNPLSLNSEEVETKREDIALLCSNCHKMVHKKDPIYTIEELKNIIKENRNS
jgi:5-methylcytosine-specific restriction protein A